MNFAQLRPLSLGELLDGAFTLYRRYFSTLVLIALVPALPVIALWLIMAIVAMGAGETAAAVATLGGAMIAFPFSIVATVLSWGAITHFVARAYTGAPVTSGDALRKVRERLWPLLGAGILAQLMIVMGTAFCFVPGLFAAAACFAVIPSVMLERRGVGDAFSRSFDLVKTGWGEIMLALLVAYLIAALPAIIVGVGGYVAQIAAADDPTRSLLARAGSQIVGQLVQALTTPFAVVTTVLLYYDRRVRTEALDVQMFAETLDTPEPGQPAGW